MNINELVADVATAPVQKVEINQLPSDGEIVITMEELYKHLYFKDKSMFSLFVRSLVNLKTEVNRIVEKERCEREGKTFRAKNVPIGQLNPQAFVLIGALKLFTERFTDTYKVDMWTYVNDRLLSKKDELVFTGLNVTFDSSDPDQVTQVNQILDALSVKFYEEAILAITYFFANVCNKAYVVNTDPGAYHFKFRDFNIMEREQVLKGNIPLNLRE